MAHLSDNEVAEFKQLLNQRSDELRRLVHEALLRADDERYNELAPQVHDAGDESVADLLSDVNLAVIDRELHELAELEAALQRIAQGSFGRCVDCQEDIDLARLHAYPTAQRCHPCQTRREKLFAGP